jgi:hypothetical protein
LAALNLLRWSIWGLTTSLLIAQIGRNIELFMRPGPFPGKLTFWLTDFIIPLLLYLLFFVLAFWEPNKLYTSTRQRRAAYQKLRQIQQPYQDYQSLLKSLPSPIGDWSGRQFGPGLKAKLRRAGRSIVLLLLTLLLLALLNPNRMRLSSQMGRATTSPTKPTVANRASHSPTEPRQSGRSEQSALPLPIPSDPVGRPRHAIRPAPPDPYWHFVRHHQVSKWLYAEVLHHLRRLNRTLAQFQAKIRPLPVKKE